MDIKTLWITFGSIFVAELADKTQLIGITLSAKSGRPFSVWLGSVLAYMFVTIITVVIGAMLSKCIREDIIRYVGAVIFIFIGILILLGKI
ncbi:MAG: TMEM165/GDT1 family protein [Candidatus Omnitrophica bacterium]|nr:TMEM165/GDT1 family protein [Candidatus Omnitrophota bacterium]MCM8778138.1 TMEM165/GDT1 family protein [Candidatus Omnitrophota bacterium]